VLILDRFGRYGQWGSEMDQRPSGAPEVLAFAPNKQKPSSGVNAIDQQGQAVVALLQDAANISKENVDRAMSLAHKLSMQLRATEDRIAQLQGEVERLQSRAARAEQWLEAIKKEIQDKLIGPMEANRPQLPVVH
jgi:TolA-binding protein